MQTGPQQAPTRPPAVPRDAATVVLLRDSATGFETLLLQRLESMSFAGGEWVFPGGAVDTVDRSERLLRRTIRPDRRTLDALRQSVTGVDLDADSATAICIAACRETFEESGILLARQSNGAPLGNTLPGMPQIRRGTPGDDPASFVALLETHDLVLDLGCLIYWSNWVTPSIAPRRFDTRFFVVACPPGQQVADELGEAQAALWLSLDDPAAPARLDPPITVTPTLFTLRELTARARGRSLAEVLEGRRTPAPAAVMLKLRQHGSATDALLPWDSEYPAAPGEGVPCDVGLRERFDGFPARLAVDPRTLKPRGS